MIKKILLTLTLLTTLVSAASIQWESNLKVAIAKGKRLNKPVMFLVNRDGCGWCDRFLAGTLSDPKVVATLNSNYVSVQGYTNRNTVPADLVTNGTPGTWFLKDGEPMFQPMMGAQPATTYLEALSIVLDEYKGSKK
ncbi:MAG: thioredoxin family protein [Campylobacterota bacterium]|nr:thioredoxin family protein [Campylobacterota bacterium]